MFDAFKKNVYAGIGVMVLTRDKIEEIMQKMTRETRLTAEEAQRISKELMDASEKQFAESENAVQDLYRKTIAGMGIVRREEMSELKERVNNLASRISMLENMVQVVKSEQEEE